MRRVITFFTSSRNQLKAEARGARRAVFSPCVRKRSRRAMGQSTGIPHAPSSGRKRGRVLTDLGPGIPRQLHGLKSGEAKLRILPELASHVCGIPYPHGSSAAPPHTWAEKCPPASRASDLRGTDASSPSLPSGGGSSTPRTQRKALLIVGLTTDTSSTRTCGRPAAASCSQGMFPEDLRMPGAASCSQGIFS